MKDYLKRYDDNLLRIIQRVYGCRIFDSVFYLVKQVFDWVICIVWCVELHIICL